MCRGARGRGVLYPRGGGVRRLYPHSYSVWAELFLDPVSATRSYVTLGKTLLFWASVSLLIKWWRGWDTKDTLIGLLED